MSQHIKPVQLSFYITPSHQCPYLDEQTAKTIFLSPEIQSDNRLYSALINHGFRRSGEHIYRPHCDNCQACVSVRIPVDAFALNKQQRRCIKKSNHLSQRITRAQFDHQQFWLFEKYINARHRDGDMYPTSPQQYQEFFLNDWIESSFISFNDPKTSDLIATCVFDQVADGLSAVYSYFDPNYASLSLGRLSILKLIELAQQRQLPYVYLGYWIKNCDKMSYKGQYRPLECFINDRWITIS